MGRTKVRNGGAQGEGWENEEGEEIRWGEDVDREESWVEAYGQSVTYGDVWRETQREGGVWPEDMYIQQGYLIMDGKVCVPEKKMREVVRQFHEELGHLGVEKMTNELGRRYHFPPHATIRAMARDIKRQCVVCQASEPANFSLKLPIRFSPIPDRIMTSVCLDIFRMPRVTWRKREYDGFLLCVDRLSGWIIAKPCLYAGLTAEEAAHLMMDGGWETFGIPSVITSDQGAHFVGQWWRTWCARMGVRQAFSQAYRAQANGRAERAGKSLKDLMRKVHTEKQVNWVEALPRVMRIYHDTPGESGLSPFEIVFGRPRNIAGLPYDIVRRCEGADYFMSRMDKVDKYVARKLREGHVVEAEQINKRRKAPPPYHVGDWVWVLRPRGGDVSALDTWWVGPCQVVGQEGAQSYKVTVKPDKVRDIHASHMKPFWQDVIEGEPIELFHHMTGYKSLATEPDEWEVEAILDHKQDGEGGFTFFVKWVGHPAAENTWEPAISFITQYCKIFPEYLLGRGISMDARKVWDKSRVGGGNGRV